MKEKVMATVEGMRDDIVSLTAELVRMPSVNPRYPGVEYEKVIGGETACNRRLAEAYRSIGCEVDFVEKEEGRANLVGVVKGAGGGRSLIYNGHIDVVPVGNPQHWRLHDPFSGRVEGGRIYGRGACDMKGGIVAQLKGVEAVLRSGVRLKGDIILESVVGEETMSHEIGVTAVSEKYKAEAAIVSEATAPPVPLAVVPATSGLIWFSVTCRGKASHASVRDEMVRAGGKGSEIAVNAIEKGVFILNVLRQLEEQWGQTKKHPLFRPGHFTLHPGVITGGPDGVLIPFLISQFCTIEYAVWYPPQEKEEDIRKEILEYLTAACQLDPWLRQNPPEVKFNLHWPPSQIAVTHPIVETCARAHREAVRPARAADQELFQGFSAVCDAAFLNAAGIPSVIYGPGSLLQAHSVDEYVEIEELITATKTFALAAMGWCGYD
ncbi:MAG: ArgE/DapE family deacylase [Acidobacteriota bacterium]